MASETTIAIVKQTVPVLKQQVKQITTIFYERLFQAHPELQHMFNMTNQKKGTQQIALADAVFAYAANIDKLEVLGQRVKTITQKHVSLGIAPAHYPIVGTHLLAAIKQVLQDAATDQIMQAWEEAYNDLAALFIGIEKQAYTDFKQKNKGYAGTKDFKIIKKIQESSNITSFYLEPQDGSGCPDFLPGQYIATSVKTNASPYRYTRNYSLSDAPGQDHWRISVKRESDKGASGYLHDRLQVGDTLALGTPAGTFTLDTSQKPLVLVGAGVGITPLMSMYKALSKQKTSRKVIFIQCMQNQEMHPFIQEIKTHALDHFRSVTIYQKPEQHLVLHTDYDYKGYINASILDDLDIAKDANYYFCGPEMFMKNFKQILKDRAVVNSAIFYEFFGPEQAL